MNTVSASVKIDGNRLRYWRHQRLMSARELADEAKVSPTTVLTLENNPDATPHPSTIRKLVEALQIEPKDVIREET